MDITIRGDNINITDNFEESAHSKLSKLSRYLPNINSIHLDVAKQNSSRGPDVVIVQITLRHQRGAILRAEERQEIENRDSAKNALNTAVDKMYRRIQRFKGKRRSKRIRERYVATAEELAAAEVMPEAEYDQEIADTDMVEPQIVRRKTVSITAMHEEEAIEQMELLGHTFFIYFDAETNSINVVYKRTNGGYGVLIPEVS